MNWRSTFRVSASSCICSSSFNATRSGSVGGGAGVFVAFRPEEHREEFRHLAARAHHQRVRSIELADAFKRLVAACVEVAGARHPEPAPFALDRVQAPDILPDPLPL